MNPIELIARREALGLTQRGLSAALIQPVAQTTLSRWEAGTRTIPAGVKDELAMLEDQVATLAETLYEAGLRQHQAGINPVLVPTFPTDQALGTTWPDLDGVAAVLHRVAAAEAMKMLQDDQVVAVIVPAP